MVSTEVVDEVSPKAKPPFAVNLAVSLPAFSIRKEVV